MCLIPIRPGLVCGRATPSSSSVKTLTLNCRTSAQWRRHPCRRTSRRSVWRSRLAKPAGLRSGSHGTAPAQHTDHRRSSEHGRLSRLSPPAPGAAGEPFAHQGECNIGTIQMSSNAPVQFTRLDVAAASSRRGAATSPRQQARLDVTRKSRSGRRSAAAH